MAREVLGWEPAMPIDTALARTIEWFRGHPELTHL